MKTTKFIIPRRNGTIKKKRNCFLLHSSRRCEHSRTAIKEGISDNTYKQIAHDHKCESIEGNNPNRVSKIRKNIQNDILKYYDDNKNIIKTTGHILKEHLNDIVFINQKNNFYTYFYNSFPIFINKYVSHIKQILPFSNDMNSKHNVEVEGKENMNKSTQKYNDQREVNNLLFLLRYYNKYTKQEIEEENIFNFIKEKVNCLNNATEVLRSIKDSLYIMNMQNKNWTKHDKSVKNDCFNFKKMNEIFQIIINRINDTNDVYKKIELLLNLTNICDNTFCSPTIYEHIKKNILSIYEHLEKKTKKGVEEQYVMFLIYKNFLSSKSKKYLEMDVKYYFMDQLSFYNILQNENINICLLSLIYRDLSFLKNYQVKYVLMNLAFSKIKNSDFCSHLDIEGGMDSSVSISISGGDSSGSNSGNKSIPSSGYGKNFPLQNKHYVLHNSLLTFFSNTLLRNNFFSFLKNHYLNNFCNTINYATDVNMMNINNYVFYNMLISIVQLKETHTKCCELLQISKMKYFLQNKRNISLFHFMCKIKDDTKHLNDFIKNNIVFFTQFFVKQKMAFPTNTYLYILNVYCSFFRMLNNDENYADGRKKKKNLLSDIKKIVNYLINEIYASINLFTLKEIVTLISLINELPKNYTFDLKNEFSFDDKRNNGYTTKGHTAHFYLHNILDLNSEGREANVGKKPSKSVEKMNLSPVQGNKNNEEVQYYHNVSNENKIKNNYYENEKSFEEEKKNDDDIFTDNIYQQIGGSKKKKEGNLAGHIDVIHMNPLSKSNFKGKKNSMIINRHDFTILISRALFNDICEDFIFKIKKEEFFLIKQKYITSHVDTNNNIYEYIIEHHYNCFLNNSEFYIDQISKKYDILSIEQIINYFILFTYISELDVSQLYSLIKVMMTINKFHPFVDFFISKHIEGLLLKRWREQGKQEEQATYERNIIYSTYDGIKYTQREFTDTYLDDYIANIKEGNKENSFENLVKMDNFNHRENSDYTSEYCPSHSNKHFDEMNLNTHTMYASHFENCYYDYDDLTSTVNLFLALDPKTKTRDTIAKYLQTYVDYKNVNILKVDLSYFLLKSDQEKEDKRNRRYSEMCISSEQIVTLKNTLINGVPNELLLHCENGNSLFGTVNETVDSEAGKNWHNGATAKRSSLEEAEKIRAAREHPLHNDVIYNVVVDRLKYDINLKNYLLNIDYVNENKEEIKHFLEKEIISLNSITRLLNYVSILNDDGKYMKLLTLAIKDIILCRHEIVEVNTFRMLTTVLLSVKQFYQSIYISSEYSYLSMFIKYYVRAMGNFSPFFTIQDIFPIFQVFIKYDLTKNYLKYLIILNKELNKINIRNFNFYLVHIILYFYSKLKYINENFISNLLEVYVTSLHQYINNMNKEIIQNLIKTNELLISLSIKNKEIIHLNYLLIQKYGNYTSEFDTHSNSNVDDGLVKLYENEDKKKFLSEENVNKHIPTATVLSGNSRDDFVNGFCENDKRGQQMEYVNELDKQARKENSFIENSSIAYAPSGYSTSSNIHTDNISTEKRKRSTIESGVNAIHREEKKVYTHFVKQTIENKNADEDYTFLPDRVSSNDNASEDNITEINLATPKFELSLVHKLNIIYFLCKFHFYNDLIKNYYMQLINEFLNNKKNMNINDEDYCKLYEIYVHVIMNFYFLSFNKNNKYINYILTNLPCYYWYKREEEKLNLFTSSNEYNDIKNILKLLNINFLTPTLTEIYFIHFFNDVKKAKYFFDIPENVLHLYQKYNIVIDDIRNKSISILCIPEENVLRDESRDNNVLINDSYYIFENIKKTYTTSLLFLSEVIKMKEKIFLHKTRSYVYT
ncbi:conserved Plasmodium protein, unknown function [Plasmodium malariae]|uniref:Uncharacterized protein n=1 Tax=Plasmodium malariae TaxID=5858 RepID=A0A1A8W6T2_PLAMA|nr:conserved Plasmodium protein, unknown function [Plasmodium malariae]